MVFIGKIRYFFLLISMLTNMENAKNRLLKRIQEIRMTNIE